MKPDSIDNPDVYLGAKLRKYTLPNEVIAWTISPSKYIQESVKSVEEYLIESMEEGSSKRKQLHLFQGTTDQKWIHLQN